MKFKLILISIGVIIATLGVFLNPFVVVKKSDVKTWKTNAFNDSVSVAKLSRENMMQDSLLWSLQQDLDLCGQNKSIREAVITKLTKERDEARAEAKTIRKAIEHYEANDLIRYFVFDKKGIFKKGCYEEVFEKPDNICK